MYTDALWILTLNEYINETLEVFLCYERTCFYIIAFVKGYNNNFWFIINLLNTFKIFHSNFRFFKYFNYLIIIYLIFLIFWIFFKFNQISVVYFMS